MTTCRWPSSPRNGKPDRPPPRGRADIGVVQARRVDGRNFATPLRRLATAEDVAAAVSAVVNDLPFTTGSIIAVDGGRPLGTS